MTSSEILLTDHLDLWTSAISRKSSAGRGRSKKFSLHGIDKLRGLILDLAVRGKLVPQDPADEPPLDLLKRVSAKRRQQFSDGKEKRSKPLDMSAKVPFSIPLAWAWSPLGAVTNYGDTEKQNPGEAEPQTWVLELEDVEKGSSRLIEKVRYSERQFQSQKNKFRPGDVIYGKLRPYLDKVLIADEAGVCTTEMVPIRAYAGLDAAYLRLFLKTPYFITLASALTHGMNLPRLGTDRAREALIAVPPLAEQHRIVAKVDELMALCDRLEVETYEAIEAHQLLVTELLGTLAASRDADELADNWARIEAHFDTLFVTEDSVEQLKVTILQLAVMGRLVAQDPQDEPASELLKRVYRRSSKTKKLLKTSASKNQPFNLPERWQWSSLGEIVVDLRYGTSKKCDRDESLTPVLRIPNVSGGELNLDDLKFGALSEKEQSDLRLLPGDILIIRSNGSLDIVGRFAVVSQQERDFAFAGYLVRARLDTTEINPKYIWHASNSKFIRDRIEVPIRHGVGLKNLNSSELASLPFPIPPRVEQGRIVAKIDELFALCESLKSCIQNGGNQQIQFVDTILSRALA